MEEDLAIDKKFFATIMILMLGSELGAEYLVEKEDEIRLIINSAWEAYQDTIKEIENA